MQAHWLQWNTVTVTGDGLLVKGTIRTRGNVHWALAVCRNLAELAITHAAFTPTLPATRPLVPKRKWASKRLAGLHSPGARPVCLLSGSVLQAEGSTGRNHEPQTGVSGSNSKLRNSSRKERVRMCCCRSLYSVSCGDLHGGSTWELVRKAEAAFNKTPGGPMCSGRHWSNLL